MRKMRLLGATAILAASLLGISAAAADAGTNASASYDPQLQWREEYDGGFAALMVSPTSGWVYLNNGTVANDSFAVKVPMKQDDLKLRATFGARVTQLPDQSISFLFTGSNLTIAGGYLPPQGRAFDGTIASAGLIVSIDGAVAAPETYTITMNDPYTLRWSNRTSFVVIPQLERGFHNVTLQTGPAFDGQLIIKGGSWDTVMMRRKG